MVKVFLFTSHFAAVLATLQLWLIIASASPANRVWIVRRDVESVTETNSQNVSWFKNTNILCNLTDYHWRNTNLSILHYFAETRGTEYSA
jgi:hypothetical protein